jgi:ribosomal protein S18 acetylase RimI-like enzyme
LAFTTRICKSKFIVKISYRNIEEAELLASERLVMRTIDHLRERSGLKPTGYYPRKVWPLVDHIHRHDPNGGFVAHSGKRLVGYASCVVRNPQWYLSFLYVDTRYQGRGIGRELLKRTLDYGHRKEAKIFSLCTYGYNPTSLALYCSFGLAPQENVVVMRGELSDRLLPSVSRKMDYREVTRGDLPVLSRMDQEIRGIKREREHLFWLEDKGYSPYLVLKRGKPVGYLIISKEGNLSPVLAWERRDLLPSLKIGLRISRELGNEKTGMFVGGKNREIIRFLLDGRLKVEVLIAVMTNKPFCDLSRYLPAHLAIF